ncbi:MAG: BatA and WFA domain-containing protein [Planctomycetaceae bacterium]|nr:BatA and WFA domain-containing protein [Planctomycetaceae bacterium]
MNLLVNPWLLAGLAGISLPVIAHLLSRRRYDVVEWAAMQFLIPDRRTRRRLKLEELLLLCLRIALICLLVFAAARPLMPSGWLWGYHSGGSRSVILVIDGSNSMSRSDGLRTLHQSAVHKAAEFLQTLSAGDSVALIDARDQPRPVIESPLQDLTVVREHLDSLPRPAGAGDLQAAVERAIAISARSSEASREIVVFTDRQRCSWKPDDAAALLRLDDLMQFPSVRPRVWVVDVGNHLVPMSHNIAVGELSAREVTVPGYPIQVLIPVMNNAETDQHVGLQILVNGQRLAEHRQEMVIPPRATEQASIELRLQTPGTHLISVEASTADDAIATDNISHVAVHVAPAVPVLLINGLPASDDLDTETFFASLALSPPGNTTPWVDAHVVDASRVTPMDLAAAKVIIIADAATLPPGIPQEIQRLAAEGTGVIVSCAGETTPNAFRTLFAETGLIPGVELIQPRVAPSETDLQVHIDAATLQTGWLANRFQSTPDAGLLAVAFEKWWIVSVASAADQLDMPEGSKRSPVALDTDAEHEARTQIPRPVVMAKLTNGEPLLLHVPCGDGQVLLMTSSLSRRWNELPLNGDFVPFLHEAVFSVARNSAARNLPFGMPLVIDYPGRSGVLARIDPADNALPSADGFEFELADGTRVPATLSGSPDRPALSTNDTFLPGRCRLLFASGDDHQAPSIVDQFVIGYDHAEDDASELNDHDRATLLDENRMRFTTSTQDLARKMFGDESRTELWTMLMAGFLIVLISEVWMTRRMVHRGYRVDTET